MLFLCVPPLQVSWTNCGPPLPPTSNPTSTTATTARRRLCTTVRSVHIVYMCLYIYVCVSVSVCKATRDCGVAALCVSQPAADVCVLCMCCVCVCVCRFPAAANGHTNCVLFLIQHGAAHTANDSGNTPLRACVRRRLLCRRCAHVCCVVLVRRHRLGVPEQPPRRRQGPPGGI